MKDKDGDKNNKLYEKVMDVLWGKSKIKKDKKHKKEKKQTKSNKKKEDKKGKTKDKKSKKKTKKSREKAKKKDTRLDWININISDDQPIPLDNSGLFSRQ